MRFRRGRDSDSAKEPEEVSQESVPPAESEPEKGPETEPEEVPEETETAPETEPQAEQPQEPSDPPETPETFEQYLMTVAVRAPKLDLAAQALVREVLQEKGFEYVLTWRLPDGSILITKR